MSVLEEKLREAVHLGDIEAVQLLLAQNVDINSKNNVNGWTALHWACKRGHVDIARTLLDNGADPQIENHIGEKPVSLSTNTAIHSLFGEAHTATPAMSEDQGLKFTPSYIKNSPLNGQVEIGTRMRPRHTDFASMPTTMLPAQTDDLILRVRIANSSDPDFIEIEVPRWKLTYSSLMHICCEELEIKEGQVERIRKLPNTRLRKDSDVKRLSYLQSLEVVLKAPPSNDKYSNAYQSISTCKDQTILY